MLSLLASLFLGQDTVPLLPNLGDFSRPITAQDPQVQRYFDQGLRLAYAFNHPEAIRSFRRAAELDPGCAMCWWGVAHAEGPNINAPLDSVAEIRAAKAIGRAAAVAQDETPAERGLIDAMRLRYGSPGRDRPERDSAWARAMLELAERYPGDDDVLTIAADAAMNLSPWNYWENGTPRPGTDRLLQWLERVIARRPEHPGACHLYIHAVEAAHPERAVACAERLADLMPGAGHLVHMPSHIYIRIGRYADAVHINRHAVHADETYLGSEGRGGLYPAAYYPHNYHFLAFAAAFAGMSAEAIAAARKASELTSPAVAARVAWVEPISVAYPLVLQVFGRWQDILTLPEPPATLTAAGALYQFARGMAHANTGHLADARRAVDRIRAAGRTVADRQLRAALEIGEHVLAGEIAMREGRLPTALGLLRAAASLEDRMAYNEPPLWHQPVRHLLGALLLRMGRGPEAETVYREDLERFPGNGWSLFGLAEALRIQGREEEAAEVGQQFRAAWKGADVALRASRF